MKLLTDTNAHPIDLLHFLSSRYPAVEWMGWPPEVLQQTLKVDFGVDPAKAVLNKALAAAAVATRDGFWEHWENFHFLVQALNGLTPEIADLQEHSLGEMMAAVDIATEIRKELRDLSYLPSFSEEVAKYVAAQAKNRGVWYLPPPLQFASRFAAGLWYQCQDCGNESEVLFADNTCDICSGRFELESLAAWKPDPRLVAKGWGRNLKYFEKNPTKEVRSRLEEATKDPSILGESQVDLCVARILSGLRYMHAVRAQRGVSSV